MTIIDGKKTLLVYLDEAGDTDFGDSGTRRFLYTALVLAGEGFPLHKALLECRYEIIAANGRFSNSHENNDYFSWAMYRKWESGDASQVARLGDNVIEIPYDFTS